MHPLVRNLYKRVLHVGGNYPTGMDHVKQMWKKALRNPQNCPSCYNPTDGSPLACLSSSLTVSSSPTLSGKNKLHESKQKEQLEQQEIPKECYEELLRAVHRGRQMVKEMIGVIQLKKYRAMKQRYDDGGGKGREGSTSPTTTTTTIMSSSEYPPSSSSLTNGVNNKKG